ncbi:MAG: hypothetical protein LBV28_00070 [Puniceicoccales bacterium]|nr:hypothetical protein [Puniceicoccales bacterium]
MRTIARIIEELQKEEAALKEEEDEKEPAIKKQFVAILSDPEGEFEGKEFTGWVVQIPEDESVYTATEKLIQSAYEFNTTKKGRRMPVETIGDACEHIPPKILKEQKVWVKTKEAIFILRTDNQVPLEKKQKRGE